MKKPKKRQREEAALTLELHLIARGVMGHCSIDGFADEVAQEGPGVSDQMGIEEFMQYVLAIRAHYSDAEPITFELWNLHRFAESRRWRRVALGARGAGVMNPAELAVMLEARRDAAGFVKLV